MDIFTLPLPASHEHVQIHPLIFVFSVLVLNGGRKAACVTLLGGKIIDMRPCKHYLTFWQK